MANNPKKVKDPTEVALSAIQEALNIDATKDTGPSSPARNEAQPSLPPTTPLGEPSFGPSPSFDRPSMFDSAMDEPPLVARRPANDDRETIGQILQAIQHGRPARNIYTLATLFGAIWIGGCALLTISFLSSLQAAIGQGPGGMLVLAGLAAL